MIADLVYEITSTSGTGPLTLGGARSADFRTFASAHDVGDAVFYCVRGGGQWEVGQGTLTSATVLARTTVYDGSAGPGVAVNFASGNKELYEALNSGALDAILASTGSSASDISFTQSVPLNNTAGSYMPNQSVSGALAFTLAANPVRGAFTTVALVANGVNTPTFPGFTEHGSSSGWVNTANVLNVVQFFHLGGVAWYAISQAATVVAQPAPDTTAPTLSSPTGASTGQTTGSGSVTTNEGNGTLYRVTTINATETAATVKAGASQAVTATGVQNITATGLTASTTYRHHFVHRDAAGNDSAVSSSATFTTAAAGDTTAPTLSAPSAAASGPTGATFSVTTNEANGTLYRYFSANATETAAAVKAANLTQAVTATGAQTGSQSGLTASTQYYGHFVHRDVAGNDSTVANSGSFATDAAEGGGYTKTRLNAVELVGLAESGTAPDYEYTGTEAGYNSTPIGGIANMNMAGDGRAIIKLIALNNSLPMLGIHGQAGLVAYIEMPVNIFCQSAGYESLSNSGTYPVTMVTPGVIPANNDLVSILKVGNTAHAEVSKDDGATWTRIFSVTHASLGALSKIQARTNGTAKFSTVYGTGLA